MSNWKLFLFIIVIYITSSLQSQEILNSENLEEKEELLIQSDKAFETLNEFKAIEYASKVMFWAEDKESSEYRAKSYLRMAQGLMIMEMEKGVLYFLDKALKEKYTKSDVILKAKIDELLSINYLHEGASKDFLEITNAILTALNNSKSTNLESVIKLKLNLNSNLANYYRLSNKEDSTFKYIKQAKIYLDSLDNKKESSFLADFLSLKGRSLQQFNYMDSSLIYLDSALNQELYDNKKILHTYHLGDHYLKRKDYECAKAYFLKSKKLIEQEKCYYPFFPKTIEKIAFIHHVLGDSIRSNQMTLKLEFITDSIFHSNNKKHLEVLNQLDGNEKPNKRYEFFMISVLLLGILAFFIVFFAQIRSIEKFSRKKEKETLILKNKVNDAFDEVVELAKKNDPIFLKRFQEVYNEFFSKLLDNHPDLTLSEQKYCALVYLKFSSKEIANYTYIEHRSVQKKKSRMRKKLKLPSDANLYDYLTKITDKKHK